MTELTTGGSAAKESTCNAAEPSSIPWLGRSLGDGISYPLQYSWATLVAQMVKNPPAMQEIWVQSLDWEDPLEEGMSGEFPWTKEPGGLHTVHGFTKSPTQLSD